MANADHERAMQRLMALLLKELPGRGRAYTEAELESFLVYLVISYAEVIDEAALSDDALRMIGGFAEKIGFDPKDEDAAAELLTERFRNNPPSPHLVADFERLVREQMTGKSGGSTASELSKFLGEGPAGVLGGTGPAPEGSVKGGLMAAVLLMKKKSRR